VLFNKKKNLLVPYSFLSVVVVVVVVVVGVEE